MYGLDDFQRRTWPSMTTPLASGKRGCYWNLLNVDPLESTHPHPLFTPVHPPLLFGLTLGCMEGRWGGLPQAVAPSLKNNTNHRSVSGNTHPCMACDRTDSLTHTSTQNICPGHQRVQGFAGPPAFRVWFILVKCNTESVMIHKSNLCKQAQGNVNGHQTGWPTGPARNTGSCVGLGWDLFHWYRPGKCTANWDTPL